MSSTMGSDKNRRVSRRSARVARIGAGIVAGMAGASGALAAAASAPAGATTTTPSGGTTMSRGQELTAGQFLQSPNGQYRLTMQSGGSLVESVVRTGRVLWATHTAGTHPYATIAAYDGNFIVSNDAKDYFASNVAGQFLTLQNDANLVELNASRAPVWANGVTNNEIAKGELLNAGWFIKSPNGQYMLTQNANGQLVETVQATGRALWHTNTYGTNPYATVSAYDGNFIVSNDAKDYFASNEAGASVVLQNDGNLVELNSSGGAVWANGVTNGLIEKGEFLYAGWFIKSPNGQYMLTMNANGQLVETVQATGRALWHTNTYGAAPYATVQSGNGNFVVTNSAGDYFATNQSGQYVALQNDGNLVEYTSTNAPVWANSVLNDTLAKGELLYAGWFLKSLNGQYTLTMNGNGQLVETVTATGKALWWTNTYGAAPQATVQSGNGNFVVTNSAGDFFATNQSGTAVVMQNDGNLVEYNGASSVWTNNAAGVPGVVVAEIKNWLAHISESWGESYNGFREYGTDFGMAVDTPIYAVESGQVLGADYYGGGGVISVAAHPGISEYYQHLDCIYVSPGQVVSAGQLIGTSGGNTYGSSKCRHLSSSTYSGGPHLEWGINAPYGGMWHPLGANQNPVPYLRTLIG